MVGEKSRLQCAVVGGGGSDQPPRPLDLSFAQSLLLCGIASYDKPLLAAVALQLGFGILDYDERCRLARQLSRYAAAHSSHATDYVVAVETSNIALHAPPSKKALQLEF